MNSAPLSSLRVVDFSDLPTGAQASQLFADYGAEVVHIEKPGGSTIRSLPSYPFLARGKKSVVLNLKDQEGLARAKALVLGADVLIESFRPGVMDRLGLGYDEISKENPGLVYGSLTAFGQRGKYANVKGYEQLVYAKVGGNYVQEILARRPGPAHLSAPYAGYAGTQTLLHGLLAALHERHTSGLGQRVDASLAQGLSALATWDWYLKIITEKWPDAFVPGNPLDDDLIPTSPLFFMLLQGLTKDGRWLQFSQVQPHLFLALMKSLGLMGMFAEEKWKGLPVLPTAELRKEFWEIMLSKASEKSLEEWQQIMDEDHDLWAEIFRKGSELLSHPQMIHNHSVITIKDNNFGDVKQVGPLALLLDSPVTLTTGSPQLGADTESVRNSWNRKSADSSASAPKKLALEGVTILELGTFFAAPYGATALADLGARVIKIEQLDGDPIRNILPFPEAGAAKVLQGKECIAVDLNSDEGREIVHKIAAKSDIVLQSFRAGVAERQGVDAKTLKRINPKIIYLNAPGYGIDGPCGDRPAYAPTIGAGAGIAMRNAGLVPQERPGMSMEEIRESAIVLYNAGTTEYAQADGISALSAGTVMALGLVIRDLTGEAHQMMTSMLNSAGHMLCDDAIEYANRPSTMIADPLMYGYGALHRMYECSDGWIYLTAPMPSEWEDLTSVFTKLGSDGRFATVELRASNDSLLADELSKLFKADSCANWELKLQSADVGAMTIDTRKPEAVFMADDFGGQAGWVTPIEHPIFGECVRLTPHVELSRSGGIARPGQLVGQSTDAVLTEFGYNADQIAALRDKNLIA